jgi:hypothetical protein
MSVGLVLLVYALLMAICVSYPLLTINDNITDEKSHIDNNVIEIVEIKSNKNDVYNNENHHNGNDNNNEDIIPDLTLKEILLIPETWTLIIFFALVLTPGWGIKLASIFILKQLFNVSTYYAECVTMIYLTSYAFGRLSAFIAEWYGVKRTYISFISIMIILLFALPTIANSFSKEIFVLSLCVIGFLYGGCKALFYSVVFDIFGVKNYRLVFSFSNNGFGIAVLVGGITSAYSFSKNASVDVGYMWFYAMGSSSIVALVIVLFFLNPYDYNSHSIKYKKPDEMIKI